MGSSTFHNFVLRKPGSHTLGNSFGVAVVQLCARARVRACVSVSISRMRPSLQRLRMKIQLRWRQEEAALVQYPGMVFCTASCPSFYFHRHGSSS